MLHWLLLSRIATGALHLLTSFNGSACQPLYQHTEGEGTFQWAECLFVEAWLSGAHFRRLTGSTWPLSVWRPVYEPTRDFQMSAPTLRRNKKNSLWAYGPARPNMPCDPVLMCSQPCPVVENKLFPCIRHILHCQSLFSLPLCFYWYSQLQPTRSLLHVHSSVLLTWTRLLNNNRCSVLGFCNFI